MKSEKLKIKNFGSLAGIVHFAGNVIFFSLLVFSFSLLVSAQSRDYFTEEEIELIRDAQQLDIRIDVLSKTIDRRFALLKIDVGGPKVSSKESDKLGPLPTGTRTELLSDIKNILQKAIDDIDNLYARPDSMAIDPDADKDKKKQKGYSDLFPKAFKSLAAAARRYEPALKTMLDAAKDDREKGLIAHSIDLCDQILEAAPKLPAEAPKKK